MDLPETSRAARAVAERLSAYGHKAFLVGGCVRDLLLGQDPNDFDISTDATSGQVIDLFPAAQLVGVHFGVVLVNGVEVATFRSDREYRDGRHPESVRFETDPRQDVLRRDFTINALMLDPLASGPTRVIDYVGGVADLHSRVIRAIGDPEQRFEEDHLRMLRAVRFAARLGFTIDAPTMKAIQCLSPKINKIAAERVRDELVRILIEGGARYGFELLDESGLLQQILPEVAAMQGVEQPPEFHPEGDVWTHTLIMLGGMQSPSPALAMGVLLHDVGKPPTFRVAERIRFDGHVEAGEKIARAILNRLRFSNEDCEQVIALIENHMRFGDVDKMRESTIKRFLRLPRFDEHLELHRLDCTSSHGHLDAYTYMSDRYQQAPPEELSPPKLLTGNDLIAAGYRPGPEFSKILAAVEDAQLEQRIATKEEALALVRADFGDPRMASPNSP